MTRKAAIVLGSSGSVGQVLIAELVRCGHFDRVVVVTRRPLNLQVGTPLRVQLEECLVPEMVPNKLSQAVVDALNGVAAEAVGFSVLGVGANTAKLTLEEHRAVDVELNAAFAQGLKESRKVQHLCFMSAIGADINAKTSGSGAAGMPRYARVKGESEAAVVKQGPAIVSIFRPAVIIGSQHTPRYLPAALSLVTWLMPAKYHSIRTTEIARAMVAAAARTPAKSEIYNYPEMMALIKTSVPEGA
jgi:uncharacterized protein YbjT (DUF2867 family)